MNQKIIARNFYHTTTKGERLEMALGITWHSEVYAYALDGMLVGAGLGKLTAIKLTKGNPNLRKRALEAFKGIDGIRHHDEKDWFEEVRALNYKIRQIRANPQNEVLKINEESYEVLANLETILKDRFTKFKALQLDLALKALQKESDNPTQFNDLWIEFDDTYRSFEESIEMLSWINHFIKGEILSEELNFHDLLTKSVDELRKSANGVLDAVFDHIDQTIPRNIKILGNKRGLLIAFARFFSNAFHLGVAAQVKLVEKSDNFVLEIKTPGTFNGISDFDLKQMLAWNFRTGRQELFNLNASWRSAGTGLGMAISWEILNDHGISVRAFYDQPSNGMRFEIGIPKELIIIHQTDKQAA